MKLPNGDRASVSLSRVLRDRPDQGLGRGWVGTLLLELAPGVWEVEFADQPGRTVAQAPCNASDLLLLEMTPAR